MRTTIDLYDDLMSRVQEMAVQDNKTIKEEINYLLALSLGMGSRTGKAPRLPAYSLGRETFSYTKAWTQLETLEDQSVADKLDQRK